MEDDDYGGGGNSMADLRQFISRTSQFPTPPPYPSPLDHQLYLFNPVVPHHHQHQQQQQPPPQFYEMMLMGGGRHVTDRMIHPPTSGRVHHDFHLHHSADTNISTAATTTSATSTPIAATDLLANGISGHHHGLDAEAGGGLGFGADAGGGTARWPRQETLTLLEVRSRLDYRFKETNQKGPLWDEVSRIMYGEHGYQRSGKKCREKFENLYKYYKKTREGKGGRQDGKHYRFFRQLEALCGQTSQNPIPFSDHCTHHHNAISSTFPFHHTPIPIATTTSGQFNNTTTHQETGGGYQSLSLSHSSSDQFDASSSEDINNENGGGSSLDAMVVTTKRRKRNIASKPNWKAKMKEFVDTQMRQVMEKQDAYLDMMMRTLEHKEQERVTREEEWRKQEAERWEREHKFWSDERAWIEARDKSLMDALKGLTPAAAKETKDSDADKDDRNHHHGSDQELHLMMNSHLKQKTERDNNGDHHDRGISHDEDKWAEQEVVELMQVRSSMDQSFQRCNSSLEVENLWDDVSRRMACLGYNRDSAACKDKWLCTRSYLSNNSYDNSNNNKTKENWRIGSIDCNNTVYQHSNETIPLYNNYGEINDRAAAKVSTSSPLTTEMGTGGGGGVTPMNDGCFRFLLSDGQSQM